MSAVLASTIYQEGEWIPALSFPTMPTGIAYATQVGRYYQIGNLIIASLSLKLSSKGTGGTGVVGIVGLPIPATDSYTAPACAAAGANFTGVAGTSLFLTAVSSGLWVMLSSLPNATLPLQYSHFTDTSTISGVVTYSVT